MAHEIERKFLVDTNKWRDVARDNGNTIEQGYLLNTDAKTMRIRIYNTHAFITIKGETSGITRDEYEYEIPLWDAREMLQRFCNTTIQKVRYNITYNGHVWEVDEFAGENSGLLLAELELTNKDEAFDLPPWIGREVSDDRRYYNAYLYDNPFTKWK